MVEGRSKAVFKTWLDAQSAEFRDGIEVVAMDGFTGFKTATAEDLLDAVAVMDPFHCTRGQLLVGRGVGYRAAPGSVGAARALTSGWGNRRSGR
jgi:transposase